MKLAVAIFVFSLYYYYQMAVNYFAELWRKPCIEIYEENGETRVCLAFRLKGEEHIVTLRDRPLKCVRTKRGSVIVNKTVLNSARFSVVDQLPDEYEREYID
jgi:hypothetical protein